MKFNKTGKSEFSSFNISKPLIAGVILIIAGLLSLYFWVPLLMVDESVIDDLKENDETFSDLTSGQSSEEIRESYMICGTIGLIISIFIILGGILSIRKKMWIVSLASAVIGSFIIVQIYLPGILCIIALFILLISKNEFQPKQEMVVTLNDN